MTSNRTHLTACAIGLVFLLMLAASALASQPESSTADEARSPDPRIGLALGSGGAAGLAHIAILKGFDEAGQRPARIAGSSIGAIIGALYAAGLDGSEIEALFAEFGGSGFELLGDLASGENGISLTDLINLDLDDGGVVDPEPFFDYLRSQIEARRFSELEIPLVVVATNFYSGEAVVIDRGDLFDPCGARSGGAADDQP
jgi:NTE family protein